MLKRLFSFLFPKGNKVEKESDKVLDEEFRRVRIQKLHESLNDWVGFDENDPPDDVVLAACDTHDCGWVIDTAWWHDTKRCWMVTGAVRSTEAHLPYTHWKKLPAKPETTKVVLGREDLSNLKVDKRIEDIQVHDFKSSSISMEMIYKAELIIFKDDNDILKILKSRYV
jgi:hypothetical protein